MPLKNNANMTQRRPSPTLFSLAMGLCFALSCQSPATQPRKLSPSMLAPVATDANVTTQWAYLQNRYDDNSDGSITPAEYTRAGRTIEGWDRNGDGVLTPSDFETDGDKKPMRMGRMRRSKSPRKPKGTSADKQGPTELAKAGQLAPDFSLESPDGGQAVQLSSFKGEKPVALIFGSYT